MKHKDGLRWWNAVLKPSYSKTVLYHPNPSLSFVRRLLTSSIITASYVCILLMLPGAMLMIVLLLLTALCQGKVLNCYSATAKCSKHCCYCKSRSARKPPTKTNGDGREYIHLQVVQSSSNTPLRNGRLQILNHIM